MAHFYPMGYILFLNVANLCIVYFFFFFSFKQTKSWKLTISLNLESAYPSTPQPISGLWKFRVDTVWLLFFFSSLSSLPSLFSPFFPFSRS